MFRHAWHIAVIVSVLLASQPTIAGPHSEPSASVQATSVGLPDPIADRVLGQLAFNTGGPGTSATMMNGPAGVAIAPPGAPNAGQLFVVEYGNHRVLSWPSAGSFATGQAADLVIGQANFTSGGGASGQNRFYGPEAAVVDASGRLWVADTENNRVLRFDPPFSNGKNASLVLGQPDYLSNDINQGGSVAANTLYFPRGLAMDTAGNLYVADDSNHRVLRFSPPFANNMNASLVIGQANFTSGSANRGGAAGQNTLNSPKGIAVDGAGNLYVAEYHNNRVTRYAPPLSNGKNASGVYGQPNYTSTIENQGGIGPGSLSHPVDIAVSTAGDTLFVTDQWNVRVLGYSNPLGDAVADQVYGQPNFTSATPNNGGVSATSINEEPLGVAVDTNGNLYHADFQNHRLLAYDTEVVGNGTPGNCTEAALDAALVGGGAITFNCGIALINLSSTKTIAAHTTLDGGGKITLSGQNMRRLFFVSGGASLTLRNIVLTDGFNSGDGGAIYNDLGGTLTLENSTIRNSQSWASGGAIVSYGPLLITNSRLENNQALNGGALYPRWGGAQTTIVNSVLYNNHATTTNGWGGAILAWDGAPVTIEGSDIYSNTAQYGGGIYNFANSVLVLGSGTLLRDNVATALGGGLYNEGLAALSNATLSDNSATYGGGIYNLNGTATLSSATLSRNTASGDGGGLYNNFGTAALSNVTLSSNSATYGGGLYNNYDTAILSNITLSGNTASISGGGLFNNAGTATLYNATLSGNSANSGGGLYNGSTASLTNVTFSGNSVTNNGGGLYNFSGTATLDNVTLSGNTAGINGGGIHRNSGSVTVKNTIVANSPSGGNCAGGVTNSGFNLSSDTSCGFNTVPNVMLGPLANNGGPTKTHMPLPGSPAIDFVATGCPPPATDQRGAPRNVGACDTGAVEYGALLPSLYLPLVVK